MAARLKIGTYILDAAKTGSTSTTTGARLLTSEDGPGFKWKEDREGFELVCFVVLDGISGAASVKTAVDAIVAAVTRTVQADVVLESAAGTTIKTWTVSDNVFQKIVGAVEVDEVLNGALIMIALRGDRLGVASGSAGDTANAIDPHEWSFALDSNGRAGVNGTGKFTTRAAANTWVQALRSGTRPAWMHANMRFVTVVWGFEQQLNQVSPVPETAYTPCVVTAVFKMLPASLAASSAFTNVVDVDYECSGRPRGPIDEEAGVTAGYDITVSGIIQFKTEADATWSASDTTYVATGAIKAAAEACITAIEADAKTRRGLAWQRLGEPEIIVTTRGEVSFVLTAISGDSGRIISWSEEVEIERTFRGRIVAGTKGERKYPHKLGRSTRVTHKLTVTGFGLAAYKPLPFITDAWEELEFVATKPRISSPEGAAKQYEVGWRGTWQFVSSGASVPEAVFSYDEMTRVS